MLSLLQFLHWIGIIIWVGGMFFTLLVLRPSLKEAIPPLDLALASWRLVVMETILTRFFKWVLLAIALLFGSGIALMVWRLTPGTKLPLYIHLMAGLGITMMLIFGHLYFALLPRLRRALIDNKPDQGIKFLNSIRLGVNLNFILALVILVFVAIRL